MGRPKSISAKRVRVLYEYDMGNGETSPTQYKVTASHAPDCGMNGNNTNDTKAKHGISR